MKPKHQTPFSPPPTPAPAPQRSPATQAQPQVILPDAFRSLEVSIADLTARLDAMERRVESLF